MKTLEDIKNVARVVDVEEKETKITVTFIDGYTDYPTDQWSIDEIYEDVLELRDIKSI